MTAPGAPRVLELGRQMLTLELSRQQLMDEIRLAHATAALARTHAAPATLAAPQVLVAADDVADAGIAEHLAPDAEAMLSTSAPPTGAIAVMAEPAAEGVSLTARDAIELVTVPESTTAAPATTRPEIMVPPKPPAPAAAAAAAGPQGPGPSAPVAAAASAPRRRLTVPVLLLIVGVSLVGIAAVFFLLLAWFLWGIAVRALIIGGITLATIALASWLRRRDLGATAEGIGALGVGLLALDAWAVRANDLFGTGSTDAALYAGASALVVAVVCRLWARVSRLRGPDLAASLAFPAGLGFLVGGLTSLPPAESLTAGLLGAAAGGLLHALPVPWSSARRGEDNAAERLVLALSGLGALVGAGLSAAFLTADALPVVIWSSIGLVVLGAAHAWLAHRPVDGARLPAAAVVSGVASVVATAAAGLAGWQLALRSDLPVYGVLVAPVLAVLVAVAIDVVRSRRGTPAWMPAAIASAVVAGLSIVIVALGWGVQAVTAIGDSWTAWRTDAFAVPVAAPEAPLLAVIAAVVITGLLFAAPTPARPVLREFVPVVATILLLVAAARTAVPGALVGVAVALVVVTVVVVTILRNRDRRRVDDADAAPERDTGLMRGVPVGYLIAGGLAAATAYAGGVATLWLWLVGVAVAMAYPIALRLALRPLGVAAVAAALAPVAVAALSTPLAAGATSAVTGLYGEATPVIAVLLQWVALATLVAAVALPVERASRTGLATAAEVLAATGLAGAFSAVAMNPAALSENALLTAIGEPGLGIARGALLLAGLTIVAFGLARISGLPTILAAALTAPVAAATAYDVLGTLELRSTDWAPLVLTAAAVAVPLVSAATVFRRSSDDAPPAPVSQWPADIAPASPRPRPADRVLRRLAADLGAALTVLVVVWPVTPLLVWAALAIVAVGFAAASVSRGWVGTIAADPADDRFATTRDGMPLLDAPRRLLAWPAVAAAIAAWWTWLDAGTPDTYYTVESYVAPSAVVLVAFAALLVRLRRRVEASIALAGGLALGLWAPAVEGWTGEPLRAVVIALLAVAVCLALSFTPVRSIRPAAPLGAAVAVIAIGLVAVERAFEGPDWQVLWLVLLVAVAYASGWGATLALPIRLASRLYALIVPPAALIAAIVAIIPLADEPRIVAGTIIMLAALHLAAAGLSRLPLTGTTRWISLAGAFAVGAAGWFLGAATQVEAVSLPVAAMCLIGAVLGTLRRRRTGEVWLGTEGPAWIVGLVLATAPSLLVAAEPVRVWAYLALTLAAAAGVASLREPAPEPVAAAAAPSPAQVTAPPAYAPPADAAGTPSTPWSPRFVDIWSLRTPTAMLLGFAAVLMGLRGLVPPAVEGDAAAAIVAGLGAVAVAVLLTARAAAVAGSRGAAALAGAGSALLVAMSLTRPDADLVLTAVTAVIGGVLGVAGASVLDLRRWAPLGGVLAVGGLVVAVVACGVRFLEIAPAGGLESDLWAVAGAGIASAIALAALRATPSRAIGIAAGTGFAVASVLFALAELQLLLVQQTGDEIRTGAVMTALTAAAVVGTAARGRLGPALAIAAVIAGAGFGILALTIGDVRPIELVTVPPALGGIAYGVRTLRREPASRTWPTLGPWLALLTVPSLLTDFAGSPSDVTAEAGWLGQPELWRIVSLGVVALAMVVIGAIRRLQAPLLLGSAVLIVHGIAQLWPWISTTYVAVPWWLWLGVGGALLIFMAARYEKNMKALRTTVVAVTSLR